MQLLEYDNMKASRKEAHETRIMAIIAIVLTLLSIVVPFISDLIK